MNSRFFCPCLEGSIQKCCHAMGNRTMMIKSQVIGSTSTLSLIKSPNQILGIRQRILKGLILINEDKTIQNI